MPIITWVGQSDVPWRYSVIDWSIYCHLKCDTRLFRSERDARTMGYCACITLSGSCLTQYEEASHSWCGYTCYVLFDANELTVGGVGSDASPSARRMKRISSVATCRNSDKFANDLSSSESQDQRHCTAHRFVSQLADSTRFVNLVKFIPFARRMHTGPADDELVGAVNDERSQKHRT